MSYKEEVKAKIGAISAGEEAYEAQVTNVVRDVYSRALTEAKITGESVESVTYEILEGVQEALLERHEEILHNISEQMVQIIHDQANECIDVRHQKAREAQMALTDTIEREKAHLNESLDAFRAFARDKQLNRFSHYLQNMETHIKGLMHTLSQKITSHAQENRQEAENEDLTRQ